MVITQIEDNIKQLITDFRSGKCLPETFIYELLLAYGHRKQSVTRLRSGERNLATEQGEVIWKRHLYFKQTDGDELHTEIDRMQKEKIVGRHKLRFVITTNFNQLLAVDTKTGDTLDIDFSDLPKHFDFFLPWAGMEKAVYQGENPADVKAAEKMAKLFDLIKADNFDESNQDDAEELHNLNVFLTRLLFCFFAEDTEIFSANQFSHVIESHTKADGSDLADYLNRLFEVLNTADVDRENLPEYLSSFPYVNGGLFEDNIPSPTFSTKSRKILIECGSELDWSDINPDIFGSMMQAVVHPDQRGGMGMHYTSITNIMKVIEPLFLNELYEEFEKHEDKPKQLQQLLQRLGAIKIFDPACGSGNFLIIAYKELRNLEMDVLKQLQEIEYEKSGQTFQAFSEIKLSQFFGIELDDFAHEVAVLSLWLAEHQMNVEFKTEFGNCRPSLPLKKGGNIICENATRIKWEDVCLKDDNVFVLGNPPYIGSKNQSDEQKIDMDIVFDGELKYKKIDYIGCWFKKASDYIKDTNSCFAFVSTNSICQGEQVSLLWPSIFSKNQKIFFGYQSFHWTNSARGKAGVTCIITGVCSESVKDKNYIFNSQHKIEVSNISPYLIEGSSLCVYSRKKPISDLPLMIRGSQPTDDGNFILSALEKKELIDAYPEANPLIKNYMGADDFINAKERYCIWIPDDKKDLALSIDPIKNRIIKIKEFREKSKKPATRKKAEVPYRFDEVKHQDRQAVLYPVVSSYRRKYVPVGFVDKNTVVSNLALVVYDAKPYMFAILSSRMNVLWLSITGSRMRNDYRYSVTLCYNNFPIPPLSNDNIDKLTEAAINIVSAREEHPSRTIASLYDPKKMPDNLLNAHHRLDSIVDEIYSSDVFQDDQQRLECLFSLYEKIIGSHNA